MPPSDNPVASPEMLELAERLRRLLSQWVRTTRQRTQTQRSARMETLRLLQESGPATISSLAQQRAVKHQSMRQVVELLAAEGSVQKRADPSDGRSQIVQITARGRAAVRQEQSVRTRWIATVLAQCGQEETLEIFAAIRTLESLLASATGTED